MSLNDINHIYFNLSFSIIDFILDLPYELFTLDLPNAFFTLVCLIFVYNLLYYFL